MGEEIEIYILKKLDDAINESKDSSKFHLAARFYLPKLHKEFTELKELIENKRKESTTTRPPVAAAVATSESNAPAVRDSKLPDHDSKTPSTSAAGGGGGRGKKESKATPVDEKESDAHSDASDEEESEAPESDTPSDAVDEKETSPPLTDGCEKESDALLTTTSAKTDELEASSPDTAAVPSGGATDPESKTPPAATKAATSAKSSKDESEISHATDAVTGDTYHETITPKTTFVGDGKKELDAAPKTATFAKTSSPDDSEITRGKKESNAPLTDKTGTTKPVNEEATLREQLYYLNNVLTEWQMITRKPFSYSLDSISSIKDLSKTLKKIKQDLKAEPTKKTDESSIPPTASIDNASLIRTPEKVVEFRWSTRLVNLEKVRGFEDKILSLERLLVLCRKDTDPFKAFGIHGMAGVGKTTLCQSIFNRPKVMGYFFPRIWVCLSKQKGEDEDNRKEVVKRMLRCLGIDDKIINMVDVKQGIRGLLFALRLQLTGKRYFIVLDDAYNADEWFKMLDSSTDAENDNERIYHKFSYGLPKECGGTVIVTSRVEQVVKNMVGEEENLRCIEPLTDQDTCWNIFKDTVEEDGTQFPGDLNKLKAEIVKRCDGLPLAAKLLGQIKHKELAAAGNQRAPIQAGNQ